MTVWLEACAMSTKQGNQGSESAALRARLKHPVVDSDGHWVEFGPDLMDYLKEVGGSRAAEGFQEPALRRVASHGPAKGPARAPAGPAGMVGRTDPEHARPRNLDAAEAVV